MNQNIFQILWIFPIYSFFGWCLEVVFCSVNTGKFVNRGFLNGASCPIYGLGAVFLIFFLKPLQDNLLLLYFGSLILGSLLELVGGFLLKKLFHITWWDYSDQPLNVSGYICLKFSLAWGVAGVLLMHVIHPLMTNVILVMSAVFLNILLVVFYFFFIVDLVITVVAVLKLNRDLQEIARLSELIHRGSDRMAEGLGNTAIELAQKTKEISEHVQISAKENREKLHGELEHYEKLNKLLNSGNIVRLRLLKAFPKMRNLRDNNALNNMKLRIEERVKKRRGGNDQHL